jgi:hypothetical protein
MNRIFYRLQSPMVDRTHEVYGRPEWERRFGRADYSDKVGGMSIGRIVLPIGTPRVDLTVILPSSRVGDFVWTWLSDCIVTDGTLSLFRQAGFTGFQARHVTVEKIERVSRKKREQVALPPLWELLVWGQGGDADPESGIRVIDETSPGMPEYSSFRNGIIVDEASWDGSDFFTVNGYPKFILVTQRVKELIIGNQLTNCSLVPSHMLEWGSDARPEELMEQARANAARDLESLLADLDDPDESKVYDAISALGDKGDHRAVDRLIEEFDHPNYWVWSFAASAVQEIAGHKGTSEETREEIFAKLRNLLAHHDPRIRKSAATAFGYMGGDRAAEVLVALFEDPDEAVRGTAVFLIGLIRYTPALEAVRRLTRDRSREVREDARRVLRELISDLS